MKKRLFLVYCLACGGYLWVGCGDSGGSDGIDAGDDAAVGNDTSTATDTTTESDTIVDTSSETSTGADTSTETDTAEPDGGLDAGGDASVEQCVGLQVIQQPGGTINADTTWAAAIYELQSSLTVTTGTLTVEPCTTIKMPDGGNIYVQSNGALHFVGTNDMPIKITSSKSSPTAGDWDQIEFYDSANNGANRFEYVIVEYGGGSSYGSIWVDTGASLAMTRSTVRYSADVGIDMDNGAELKIFTENSLINNAQGPISIGANSVDDLGQGTYSPNTVEGITVNSETVDHPSVWLAHDAPYLVPNGFTATTSTGSAHLTINAGAVLKMGAGAGINIEENAGLTLDGTASSPVTVTSDKGTPAPGDWNEIEIHDDSSDGFNVFTYAVIENGGGSSYGAIWLESGASLAMTNSTVRYSNDVGIDAENGAELRDFTGNTLTNNASGPIEIGANSVDDLGDGTYTPNTVEGIIVRSETIDEPSQWLALDAPYVANDGFTASTPTGSARLTINAGATLKIGDGAGINIEQNAGLTLNGTTDKHITITCSKPACAAGDWDEIELHDDSTAAHNHFTYVDIIYGGGDDWGQLYLESGASVTLENTTFSNPQTAGCDIDNNSRTINTSGTNVYDICP
jgi:hypothetical protein